MEKIQYNNFNNFDISLDRDTHTYNLLKDSSIDFISVTTFISEFFEKFNSLKIATKLVRTSPKYSHMKVEELLEVWRGKRDHGTKVHNEIEDYLIDDKYPEESKAIQGINWLDKHIYLDKHKVYSEKIIYSEELKLAGSVDLIIKHTDTDEYTLVDWKTNDKISTSAFRNQMGTHIITSDIEDCKYNLYALQLSLYRYLLEEYYGLKIKSQLIAHLRDDRVLAYMTPYFKSHMEQFAQLRMDEK